MNEWLDDELAELRKEEDDKLDHERRLDLIRQHTARLWNDLKSLILDAAVQIDQAEELRKKIGQLETQDAYVDKVIVNKVTYPAIYLTVSRGPNSVDIQRVIVTNGANRQKHEQRESLEVDLDEHGHPFFRNKEGASLVVEEAVHYIFRPFLHPELLAEGRTLKMF